MLNKDFENTDLILHEMGIPPIHTPSDVLASFSDEIKKKMYLVHVCAKHIPPNKGLKSAPEGLDNTIILVKESAPRDILFN